MSTYILFVSQVLNVPGVTMAVGAGLGLRAWQVWNKCFTMQCTYLAFVYTNLGCCQYTTKTTLFGDIYYYCEWSGCLFHDVIQAVYICCSSMKRSVAASRGPPSKWACPVSTFRRVAGLLFSSRMRNVNDGRWAWEGFLGMWRGTA